MKAIQQKVIFHHSTIWILIAIIPLYLNNLPIDWCWMVLKIMPMIHGLPTSYHTLSETTWRIIIHLDPWIVAIPMDELPSGYD